MKGYKIEPCFHECWLVKGYPLCYNCLIAVHYAGRYIRMVGRRRETICRIQMTAKPWPRERVSCCIMQKLLDDAMAYVSPSQGMVGSNVSFRQSVIITNLTAVGQTNLTTTVSQSKNTSQELHSEELCGLHRPFEYKGMRSNSLIASLLRQNCKHPRIVFIHHVFRRRKNITFSHHIQRTYYISLSEQRK
jgi:hypothetical protein